METFGDLPEEVESEEALAIVDTHRGILGIEPFCVFQEALRKYHKKVKKAKAKEGKGSKIKLQKPTGFGVLPSPNSYCGGTLYDAKTVVEYCSFCLRIQAHTERRPRTMVPQWPSVSRATMGDHFFYYLLKKYGDDEDVKQLQNYKCNTFCNHPNKHTLWSKVSRK